MNLIEIPSIDDIAYFVGTNSRAENDAANRIREDILTCLYSDIPNEYFANEDRRYFESDEELWKEIHEYEERMRLEYEQLNQSEL